MILTHRLVLLSAAPLLVVPQPAALRLADAGTMVALPARAAALLPAVPVRASPVLMVRGD